MPSMYDGIQTAAELITEVQIQGLSLAMEDICRIQDIFGHTPVKELVRLANDIGRNNSNGEPDPKGTWSSNRKATQGTFYMIVSHIWNWEEVTRFWNNHTNPEHEELIGLRTVNQEILAENRALSGMKHELQEEKRQTAEAIEALHSRIGDAERRAEEAEAEVVRLKAKLYDLLIDQKEKT